MIYTNEMIEASKGQPLAGLTEKEQVTFFRTQIHKLYELKGIEPAEKEIGKYLDTLIADVRLRFKGIKTTEIALALKYGLAENFSKDTRLVGSNFLLWLERYMTAPERLAALNDSRTAERRQNAALLDNEADKEERRAEFVANAPRRAWEEFKKNGGQLKITLDGYAAALYDALVLRGKLNAREETKEKAKVEAQKQLRAEAFARGRKGYNPEDTQGETYRTKRILLDAYFKQLYARGVELS